MESERLAEEEIENQLVEDWCQKNGWEVGGNEDYDIAVSDVKWFLAKLKSLGYVKITQEKREKIALLTLGLS